jgi:transcription initiation factor IIE alpha subunit
MENEDFICEECEAEFTLIFDNEVGIPDYCPFCGNTLEKEDEWGLAEDFDESDLEN